MRSFSLCLVAAVLTAGCRPIPTAPTDVDGALHYLWTASSEGSDADVAVGLVNVSAALDVPVLDGLVEGAVTDISAEGAALVGIELDPSEATGGYVARPIACSLSQIEAILSHTEQDEIYDSYDAYAREWSAPTEDWRSGDIHRLDWNTAYTLTALGNTYSVETTGLVRRILDEDGAFVGIVQRSVLDEPADIEGNSYFEQDYQLELFWDRGEDVVHLYTIWKDSRYAGFDDETELSQRTVLNSIDNWDDNTEAACESGQF